MLPGEEHTTAPRGVQMQPHTVLVTDVSDRLDRIEGAQHCGTTGGIHEHGMVTLKHKPVLK